MFNVIYVDDFKKTHYTVASSIAELKFILDRFLEVHYSVIES